MHAKIATRSTAAGGCIYNVGQDEFSLLITPQLLSRLAAIAHVASCLSASPAATPPGAISYLTVPAHPFSAIASRDGQWIFVSLIGWSNGGGISVLHRAAGKWSVRRTIACGAAATGLAMTHDGEMLVAASDDGVATFDVLKLTSGQPGALRGIVSGRQRLGTVSVAITPDDRFAFVSDEGAAAVTVVDLDAVRRKGASPGALVGQVPVGLAPVGLALSPDGRYLYSTSEASPAAFGWQALSNLQAPVVVGRTEAEGPLIVIDVHQAETDPANAVVSKAPAGYCPVRVAVSPDGKRAYVTARDSNTVNVFDTLKLRTDPLHAQIGAVPVGAAPVGIIEVEGGQRVITANSNRYDHPNQNQTLSVVDATRIPAGAKAVLATIPAGAFPRELHATPDGKTLIVTNFSSDTVEFVDLGKLPSAH